MRKLILFITVLVSLQTFAQEGTKQFMPTANDTLWMEFNVFDHNFAGYDCKEKERLNVYLRAGETMHFGMKMNTYNYPDEYWFSVNPYNLFFQIKDPNGIVVVDEHRLDTITTGYIADYQEAITGPNGVLLNGTEITGGYDAKSYTATTTGNHYFEFRNRNATIRYAIEFFDVTVTDASGNVVTNPDDPNRSAGRLWSYAWQLCNTSFYRNPVNANFYVVTDDRLINKVNFEMTTYSFVFLANKFGITDTSGHYIKRTQSMEGDQISNTDIAEYPVFLNDPDRTVWPNILLTPPKVQVWAEEELFMDYNYNRNPLYLPLYTDTIILEKNRSDCPYDDVTFFKIETSLDGYAVVLIDVNKDGEYSSNNSDRVIYKELKKGLNYVLWDFKTDAGASVPNGIYNASATFLGRGPSHFPLYDVEQLSGITTSAIRPFNKLNTTIYWDDTQISDWGDKTGTNAMSQTQRKQLRVENHVPRTWSFSGNQSDDNNGNLNTMNTWFNAIDLGYSSFGIKVQESDTKCINGAAPYVGDLYLQGPLNTDISFDPVDMDYKFFHPSNATLSSIRIISLPTEGTLKYDGTAIPEGDLPRDVARGNIELLTYTPDAGFHGIDSLLWKASDGINWSNNQENIYLIINTDPTISEISNQKLCTNTPTGAIDFTVGDADGDELTVTGFSANPEFVPHTGIVIGGSGTNRTVTVTPVANKSGRAIIYVMVDDGYNQVIEEFAVVVSPSLEFDGDTIVCEGDPLDLRAEEMGATYNWKFEGVTKSTNQTLLQDPLVDIGQWSLTVTKTVEGNTCSSTRNFNVSVAPITTFTGDLNVCAGETISLVADEVNASYSWKKNGTQVSTSRTYTKTNASSTDQDTYTLWVSKYGCENTSPAFNITVKNPASTSNIVTGNTVDPGYAGTLTVATATNGITYNVYAESDISTVVASGTGSGTNLDISVPHTSLLVGNNIFKVGASNGNCEVMLTDTGKIVVRTPGVTVSTISGNTSEDEITSATFTVKLNTKPSANVTINLSSSDISEGEISLPVVKALIFTPDNYSTLQTVTIIGVNDFIIDGNIDYTINLGSVSTDGNYNGLISAVDVTNDDNDVAGVTVNPISGLTTTELLGGTAQFEVELTCQPNAEVTITLSSSKSNEGLVTAVSPGRGSATPASNTATITFDNSNWSTPVTVTVTGQDDDIDDNDQPYNIITSLTSCLGDLNFNGLLVDDVQISNSDDDEWGVTIDTLTVMQTNEAGTTTARFSLVLESEPTANVQIGISSSDATEGTVSTNLLTFDAGNWDTPQMVTVTGVNDDIDDGNIPYKINTAAIVSGDTNYGGYNPDDVNVLNLDDDAAGLTVNPDEGLVTSEDNDQATFTVKLNSKPVNDIVLSFTSSDPSEGNVSSSQLTFTSANWNVNQTVTVTGQEDNIIDGPVDYNIGVSVFSGDAVYVALPAINISATNNDNDFAGLHFTKKSLSTTESGTSDSLEVRLTAQPASTVNLSITGLDPTEGSIDTTSLSFTTVNWNAYQKVKVTGLNDAMEDGNIEYELIFAYTSGDVDFSAVKDTVTVENADDDVAGISVSPSLRTLNITEGNTGTFTISLNTQPAPGETVTFTFTSPNVNEITLSAGTAVFINASWNPVTITVTAVNDNIDDLLSPAPYIINLGTAVSGDGNYSGMSAGNITVNVTDIHTAGITNTAPSRHTTEAGGDATFTVVLNTKPTASVTVTPVSQNINEGEVSGSALTFTTGNWNIPQSVTVIGQDDDIDDGNQDYNLLLQVSSTDTKYGSSLNKTVGLVNDDDDNAGLILTDTLNLQTAEAGPGTAVFKIALNSKPTDVVTISFTSSRTGEGTVIDSIKFAPSNWNIARNVTITGVDELVDDGNQDYFINISVSSSDGNYGPGLNTSVDITNIDNDVAGVTISPTSGLVTTEAGGTATFTVVLDTKPTDPVTINLNTSDNTEGTVPVSINFTTSNWNAAQTVTITGVEDHVDDGDITYTINTSITTTDAVYKLINPDDVTVKNIDNDNAGVIVNPISGLQTTEGGVTAQFTIRLSSQPTDDVKINLSSSNTNEGTVTSTPCTFTKVNWSTEQTFTITGKNDSIVDGDVAYTIITTMQTGSDTTYNKINPDDVSVINIDNDVAGFTVNPPGGLYTHESGIPTQSFTVNLKSKPYANVSIALASNDESEGTIDKSSLTFTPVNWSVNQVVTITGQDDNIDDESVGYKIILSPDNATADTNYVGLNPQDVSVINEDNDAWGFNVTPLTLSVDENGISKTFTIVLRSEPTDTVRIGISSEDISIITVDTDSIKFAPDKWNIPQTVTVGPVNNNEDELMDPIVRVFTSTVISKDNLYNGKNLSDVTVTVLDDDAAGITVSEISGTTSELDVLKGTNASFSIVLNSEPTDDVEIQISSSNTGEGTLAPASVTFTSLDWNIAQFITVTGVDDAPADGNITYYVRFDTVMSSDVNYSGYELDSIQVVNVDNDKPGVTVFPYSERITTEAGGTSTFNVKLNSQPEENVTISLESSDTGEGVIDLSSLLFTSANWSTNQLVTITGIDDLTNDGNIPYTISISGIESFDAGYDTLTVFQDVAVVNMDDIGPRATDDIATTDEDSDIIIDVLSNDLGLDDGNLSVSVTANPTHGTVVVNTGNTITYNPNGLFNGDDTFTYRVCDGDNDCDEATVTVTVTGNDDFPVAVGDSRGTSLNTNVLVDVLFNDYGMEDGGIFISIEQQPEPTKGTATAVGDEIQFAPAADYLGLADFIYRITDGDGDYDTAIVTINVREVNHEPVANDDNAETTINTDVTISVLANDSGLEDGFGKLEIYNHAGNGTAVINNRTITYTPDLDFTGEDSFMYLIEDVDGDYDTATVSINVLPVGDAQPVALDDACATDYETPVYLDVLVNDQGLADRPLILSVTTDPLNGTALVDADSILYTPYSGFSGIETLKYQIRDNDGDNSNIATVTITVLPINVTNHKPVALNDTVTTNENTPITVSVLNNDTILDGFGKLQIYSTPEFGTTVVNANRTITYTPSNSFIGADSFEYWVEDVHGDYDIATVFVDVIVKPNAIPVANNDERGTNYETARYIDVLVNDIGLDDGGIILKIITVPADGAASVTGDSILFTPEPLFSGTSTFEYSVTDKDGDGDTALVTITVKPEGVNNYIPVALNDTVLTYVNQPIDIYVLNNDTLLDDFGDLKIHSNPQFGSVTVNGSRSITYTPFNMALGNDSFEYWVQDEDGDYDIAIVFVEVTEKPNSIPVANDDERGTNFEEQRYIDVLFNDTGLDDGGIVIKVVTPPVNGTASVFGDSILYTPEIGFSGYSDFSYSVTDVDGEGDTARVTINVYPEGFNNHIPVAVDDSVSTYMNTPVDILVLNNDTLKDGFGALSIYSTPSSGTIMLNTNRTFTYTPNPWFIGNDSLKYYVRDEHGDFDVATVFIEVTERPNAVPVANDDERGTNYQSQRYVDVLKNDSGLEDGGIILKIITAPVNGTAEVTADSILYTPEALFSGTSIFEYSVTDKDGDGDTARVTITVLPEGINNHIPVALNDSAETIINTPIDINVLANDTILDAFGELILWVNPKFGTAIVNANRTITYTPSNLFVGNDSLTYYVRDEHGDFDVATVFIEVTERPNAVPVANDDECGTNYQTQRYVDVLYNDNGLEDGGIILKIITAPVNGTAEVKADSILYTPEALFSGTLTFEYSVTDKDGDGDTARVTITVLPEGVDNHIPVALNDSVETIINTPIDINVLANDTILDAFGELILWVNPKFGTAIVNANRTITYTPSNLFVGNDSLTYYVRDEHGDFDVANVFIEVTERPNAVPVANNDERGTNYQTQRYVDVLKNDSGLEDGGIILKIITAPVNGSAVVTADSILYTPEALFSGTSTFEYSVTDKDGDGDTARVTITVLPEGIDNHIPVAINDSVITTINVAIDINVLANDTITDGFDDLKIYSNPAFGSVTVNNNRTITYTPSNLFKGNDRFDYWIEDIHGDYDIATVFVTVTEVPDALPVANDDARGTEYQTMVSVDVLTNDTGLDDKPVTITMESDPAQGSVIVNVDRIEFTPANGFAGLMTFEYRVTDKDGDFDVARVTITVKNEGEINYIPVAVNDSVETMENTPIDINVLANDSGLEDGFKQIIIFDQPEFGAVVVNPNRTVSYQPSPWFIGTEEFIYWVEDLDGDYDTACVVVHVEKPGNHLPEAFDDARGTNFDTPVTVDVLTNDKGLEDGGIVVSVENNPAQGSVAIINNEVVFTPESGFTGKETFSYRVTDKEGDYDIANIIITVKPYGVENLIPVAVNDTVETVENTPITISILANDLKLDDGFGKIILFTEPLFGDVQINNNRTITYTPANAFIGADSLVYWVEDIDGDYDMASVFIEVVVKPDYQPIANDDARGCDYESSRTVDVLTNDTSLDDAPVLVTVTVEPSAAEGTTMVNADNTITFTAATGFSGTTTFRYTVTDNDGDSDDAQVTITVLGEGETNHIPVAVNDTVSTIVNTPININVLANDTIGDVFGRLIVHQMPQYGTAEVFGRTIVYTPSNMFVGIDKFDYWVEDAHGDYAIATVVIEVTDKPDYQPIANDDARGCEYESIRTVDVLTNDTGLDDAPVIVTVTTEPNVSEGTTMVNADNTITFIAATGFSGTTTFRYTVSDNDGDTDDALVTITVLGQGEINHIPVAVNDTVSTIVNTSINISVLANDTIEDNFGRLIVHHAPQFGTAVVTSRTIVYTPSNMFVGTDKFDYWVEDIHGDYSIASVVIDVTDRPDYQPIANDDARGCEYESTRTVDVLTNDTGLDDAPILVTVTVAPNAAEGTTMVNADNTITFTAATGFSGTTTFRYTVTDNDGDTDDALVTITVLGQGEINHIPVAVNDTVSTIVNTSINISVLANDTIEDNFGRLIVHHAPQFGTAVVTSRTIVYTPSNMFVGTDKFDYWVEDVHGDYAIATVVIDVTDRPDYQPIANDDARGCEYESTRTVDVLTNDTGLDDAPILVTVTVAPNAAEGTTMVNADNTITFTAATGFAGITTFRYTVTDNDGDTDDAQVTITVLPEGVSNHIPLAVDDEAFTIESNAVDINVLANDNGLNDGIQSVIIFRTPAFGNVTVNADYTVTYVPSPYFVGIDEFEYLVSDVHGDNDIAKVTVDVRAIANNIPVANDDSRGTSLNTDVVVDVLANDTGLEDGGITVSIVSNPSNGTIIVNLDNTVTYTPNTGFMGTDQFEYQVCDINNDCDAATVTINVKEINYNPFAVDDKYYIETNSTKTIDVLDNDSGLEDGGIEVEILTQVMVGQAIVNDDNSITYTSLTGFEGVDYFAYKVTDIDGDYDIAMVSVHVTSGPLPGATITYAGNTSEDGREVQLSIVLNTEPTADVSIELSSQDLTEGTLSSGRVTFTSSNWSTPQVISVTGVDDHLIDGNIEYRIGTQNMVSTDQVYDGLNVESVTLINEDNDVANIILAITNYTTSEDTENTQFTLELATEPVSEVSINIINSDVTEGLVEPENIVFTPENWNVKQTITVSGLDDDLKDGDIQYELSFAVTSTDNHYDMFSLESLQLTNIDNDGKFGLVIPEAFSPDNDGYNDKFEILGLEKYSKLSIKIYNRWGNLVYSENSYQNNWDGKANATMAVGKELPTGTYFYIITIRDINKEMSGYIFLKR